MFTFIEQHKRLVLFIVISVIILMILALIYQYTKQNSPTNNSGESESGLEYTFLKEDADEMTDEDRAVILLGIIHSEGFGTYSYSDVRGLQNVQNYATDEYKARIQKIIDTIPQSKQVSTIMDPESARLTGTGEPNSSIITMNGVTTENGKEKNITSIVSVIKVGEYWLIKDIVFRNR